MWVHKAHCGDNKQNSEAVILWLTILAFWPLGNKTEGKEQFLSVCKRDFDEEEI